MSILFQTSGLLTTLQDLGRIGFRRFGINPSGAMDRDAARLTNILLGNHENTTVLEMHFPAPRLLFEKAAVIALGGADFGAKLNDQPVDHWRLIFVRENSVLNFSRKIWGSRLYLAIRKGFLADQWLGSASTNLKVKAGGFGGRALIKGDRIFFNIQDETESPKNNFKISDNLVPRYASSPTVRVICGAEWNYLIEKSRSGFLSEKFRVKNESDRMGFRLEGARLETQKKIEMISSGASFGTIQLLPSGQLIILMADHQTTGGYPRIAHVISLDLPLVAQIGSNDTIDFEIINVEKAENLLLQHEVELNYLRTACKFIWMQSI